MNDWVMSGLAEEDHTFLNTVFSPPPNRANNAALRPPNAIGVDICREAASVAHHYGVAYGASHASSAGDSASAAAAAAHPPPLFVPILLAPPLDPQPLFAKVPCAKVALPALLHRIQSLNDRHNYPTISRLPRGSYICDIAISWSNAGHSIALFKL